MSIVARATGHVGSIEICRPPHNFFDVELVRSIADALQSFDTDANCRAIVLCSQGSSFCAGADFSADAPTAAGPDELNPIYVEALRIFSCTKPIVAAVHGPAVGGGLGLALACDFRVTCAEARFVANFTRLGVHPGFGLTTSLPRLVGVQTASLLLLTGRRVGGEEAVRIGLADMLVERDEVRAQAHGLAAEIAAGAPLALQSTRAALRVGLVDAVRQAVAQESRIQSHQFQTQDFREGVKAMAARRPPAFTGC